MALTTWRYPNMVNATRIVALLAIIAVGGTLALDAGPEERASAPQSEENASGSIWIERHGEDALTYYVFHGDGIATGFNRDLGIGVGQWMPLDERSLVAELGFTGTDAYYIHLEPATAALRFTGEIDESGDTMVLSFEENTLGQASSAAERKKMVPMPPEAETVTPPDPGWQPRVGIHSHAADDSGVILEEYGGRPNQTVEHSDGTWVSINSWVGPGVGLLARPDEYHGILTAWFTNDESDDLPLVGEVSIDPETGVITNRYGDSNGFSDSAPMEPQPEPEATTVDPAWWPSLGSLWVDERDGGPSVMTAIHADGTLLTIDPYRGVGVGNWVPTGPDSAALVIDYYDTDAALETVDRGRSTLRGELLMDEAHENASIEFTVENTDWITQEVRTESGSATLRRVPMEA
jgi:hypothetical protein